MEIEITKIEPNLWNPRTTFERAHYLAFVDCEGLEVNWSTVEKLLDRWGDIWFTFQSKMATRVVGRALSGSLGDKERLNTFFGGDGWET